MKLSEKVGCLEGQNICLQNIKRELLEQVGESVDYVESLEKQMNEIKDEYSHTLNENNILKQKIKNIEVQRGYNLNLEFSFDFRTNYK